MTQREKMEEALNAVQRTAQHLLGHDTVRIVPDMAERARANDEARSRVLALFDLEQGVANTIHADLEHLAKRASEAESSLERLKAEQQFTAKQVIALLDFYDTGNDFNPNLKSAIEALRRLSQSSTEKE